jgi:hypothetical protein
MILPESELAHAERHKQRLLTLVYLRDHQARGQFITLARRLLQIGIVKPSALELAESLDTTALGSIDWIKYKRHVNRLSVCDLTSPSSRPSTSTRRTGGRSLSLLMT